MLLNFFYKQPLTRTCMHVLHAFVCMYINCNCKKLESQLKSPRLTTVKFIFLAKIGFCYST